jgi:hypothetical protein
MPEQASPKARMSILGAIMETVYNSGKNQAIKNCKFFPHADSVLFV